MVPAAFEAESLDEHTQLLTVSGELDLATSRELRRRVEACLREGNTGLVIDISELTHMDSSGLAALISAHQLALEWQAQMALVVDAEHLRRTLEVRGVDRLFAIYEDRDDAVAAVRR